MLTNAQVAEIKARAVEDYCNGDHITYHGDVGRLLADRDELVRRLAKVMALLDRWQSPAYRSHLRSSAIVRGSSEVWKVAAEELWHALAADCPAAPAEGAATREDA